MWRVALAALALGAAGCGLRHGGETDRVACSFADGDACYVLTADELAMEHGDLSCSSGEEEVGSCPDENTFATCTVERFGFHEVIRIYEFSLLEAQEDNCRYLGGTWDSRI